MRHASKNGFWDSAQSRYTKNSPIRVVTANGEGFRPASLPAIRALSIATTLTNTAILHNTVSNAHGQHYYYRSTRVPTESKVTGMAAARWNWSFGIARSLKWLPEREFIEREQESIGLKSEPQPTDAPTRVVIHDGEGFRPASPSQMTS